MAGRNRVGHIGCLSSSFLREEIVCTEQ